MREQATLRFRAWITSHEPSHLVHMQAIFPSHRVGKVSGRTPDAAPLARCGQRRDGISMTTPASGEVRSATIDDQPDKVADPAALSDRPAVAAGPFWNVAAVISVVTLLVLNIIVSRTAIAPRTPWDEIAPLQMARELAGQGPVSRATTRAGGSSSRPSGGSRKIRPRSTQPPSASSSRSR